MNNLKSSVFARLIAIVLLTALAAVCIATAAGAFAMNELQYFTHGEERAKYNLLQSSCRYEADRAVQDYISSQERVGSDNIFVRIEDENGRVLWSEAVPEAPSYTAYFNVMATFRYSESGERCFNGSYVTEEEINRSVPGAGVEYVYYTAVCYLPQELAVKDDLYLSLSLFNMGCDLGTALIWLPIVCFILGIMVFVFLLCAAGHHGDEIRGGIAERIPFDVFTVLLISLCAVIAAIVDEIANGSEWLIIITAPLAVIAFGLVFLWWCMSLAIRVKLRTLLKGCWIYKICAWCIGLVKKLFSWLDCIVKGIPHVWSSAAVLGGIFIFGLIIAAIAESEGLFLGWIFLCAILFPVNLYTVIMLDRLRKGAKELSEGKLDSTVDTKYMYGPILEAAGYLNGIRNGISRAVDEQMKSERMKAELITNVSHDIKTPLTSIVNYVDLLSRENIEGKKANEYIDVLRRQSARLKKLAEDLVEASKASTGNIKVAPERLELAMMLEQTAGEYGEKLSSAGLELVMRTHGKDVSVMADPRHTQRIFDNLLNNIVKYAMPGTRVYLDIEESGDFYSVFFRNTSMAALNVGADELAERFVRGDASRTTEGSGLGLSIAKSLAELQGGELVLTVDGDLFKAELKMKKA